MFQNAPISSQDESRKGNGVIDRNQVNRIRHAVIALSDHCRKNNWAGYDPYDALNSRLFNLTPFHRSRVCRIAATQILKRLPVNIRPILLIGKEQNPKAIALFLMTYLKLERIGFGESRELVTKMAERLVSLRSKETPYCSWGYSFPWQTRTVLVPRGYPNLVSTTFCANALLDAYEASGEPRFFEIAKSAAEYIIQELFWEEGEVASFGYPLPSIRSRVHNANFLAGALLSRIYKTTDDRNFLDPALKAVRYSAAKQHRDGSWDYGESATQKWVDNFHTGYNLCALRSISECARTEEFESNIRRGFRFYKDNFFTEGDVPKYFHNRTHPIDIHCVAQSIITLLTFREMDEDNFRQALSVFTWSMAHMWDERGYFYYQSFPMYTSKISYMRWSHAWMLFALSMLLEHSVQSTRGQD